MPKIGYNLYLRILREKFVEKVDNYHNFYGTKFCSQTFKFLYVTRRWCTSNSYGPAPLEDHYDEVYNRSPIKCPADFKRISAKESIDSETKSFCKRPGEYN